MSVERHSNDDAIKEKSSKAFEENSSEENVQERRNSIIKFEVLPGGKEPPQQGNNWLSGLKQWTVFLAKLPSLSKTELIMFRVREKFGNSTCLEISVNPMERPLIKYFDTESFSKEYVLMDILEEGNDGPEGLEHHEVVEGDDNVVEETRQ